MRKLLALTFILTFSLTSSVFAVESSTDSCSKLAESTSRANAKVVKTGGGQTTIKSANQ